MFVTNWISTTKIQKISEITNFFRHYFLSRTEVCTLKSDRAGMKKGTVIEVTTSLASCDAHNITDACEAKFGKKSRDASHPSYWDIKKV